MLFRGSIRVGRAWASMTAPPEPPADPLHILP